MRNIEDDKSTDGASGALDLEELPRELTLKGVTSYRDERYESEELINFINYQKPEMKLPFDQVQVAYRQSDIFPDWIIGNNEWKTTKGAVTRDIAEIVRTPYGQRSQDQTNTLVDFVMSVWEPGKLLGPRRCGHILKEFLPKKYESDEYIVSEGDVSLTFYIILSGEAHEIREGEVVRVLGHGSTIGESAITTAEDVRQTSIKCTTAVEVLSIHKVDYDHFNKEIWQHERRETLAILKDCPLFQAWTRTKHEKLANTCTRKIFEPGQMIFRQGDVPDNLYILYEGAVEIIKEITLECINRYVCVWPCMCAYMRAILA